MKLHCTPCGRCGGRPMVAVSRPASIRDGVGCVVCTYLSDEAAAAYKADRRWNDDAASTPDNEPEPTAAQVDRARADEWGGVDR